MIPPSPIQFTLWGSALYTELAAGLWRALAAPWLQPGWPGPACASDRRRAQDPDPAAGPAAAASPAAAEQTIALPNDGDEPSLAAESSDRRVIEVPRGRWQHRRERGRISSAEA